MNRSDYAKIIGILVLGAMFAIAGCNEVENSGDGEELAKESGGNVDATLGEAYGYEVKVTEANQQNLVKAQPPIQLDGSLERQNLIERYKHLNDRNNVHHVYLMSNDGDVIAYFTAQGKVSSVNSKLTNDRQIVVDNRCIETTTNDNEAGCFKLVESPQMDGSYGENGDAIFFFTTSGEYVEWNGKYVVSEEPKNIQSTVTLTEDVGEDGEVTDAEGNAVEASDSNPEDPSGPAVNESGAQNETANASG